MSTRVFVGEKGQMLNANAHTSVNVDDVKLNKTANADNAAAGDTYMAC